VNRRAPILAGVASAVVVLIAVVAFLLPKISAVHKRQVDLDQARTQEQTLRTQLSQLQQDQQDAKAVQKQLQALETKIPPTADIPSLIRQLQGAADASAVDFMSTSPGAPTAPATGAGVSTIPLQITVGGSFFSVQEFLFRLEQLPRAVKVTQVGITSSGAGASAAGATAAEELSLSITAQVFTTDVDAGPGSIPGPTAGAAAPTPAPTISPGASPSPGATPTT
jgi:type IV pilus assembly protein PilO